MDEKILQAMRDQAPLNWAKAQELADQFDVKARAIVASAKKQEIEYNRIVRATKSGAPIMSKTDLVTSIAVDLDLFVDDLDGLDKATKTALQLVADAVKADK